MKRALYVGAHFPDRHASEAGHKTAYHYLHELSKSFKVDVALLTRSVSQEHIDGIVINQLHILESSKFSRLLMIFLGLFLLIPPRFATRLNFSTAWKMWLLSRNDYDAVFLDFSQVFPYIYLFRNVKNKTLSLHDLQSQVVSRKSIVERLLFYRMTKFYESRLLAKADVIYFQAPSDSDVLVHSYSIPKERLRLTAPALSDFVTHFERDKSDIQKHTILFWGAMGRVENSRAAIRFIDQTFGKILNRFPSAVLYVVGSNPPVSLRQRATPSVIITGFVEDPTEYFKLASLGIAPLEEGAGIKVKVLEMLECGLDVVTTDVGAEGIQSSPLLHLADIDDFAEAIERLWSQEASFENE